MVPNAFRIPHLALPTSNSRRLFRFRVMPHNIDERFTLRDRDLGCFIAPQFITNVS
jgi:hypothetical protein